MSNIETGKKKDKDPGQIIMDDDDFPKCSYHGYTLWIEERNVIENNAFCQTSDETIEAAPDTRLANRHISVRQMPPRIEELSGILHEGSQ
jgi:hypothetical protein